MAHVYMHQCLGCRCIDEVNEVYVDIFKFGQSSQDVRSYRGMDKPCPDKLQFKLTIETPKEFETYMLDKLKNEEPWNELLIFPPEVGTEYFYTKDNNNKLFVETIKPYIEREIIKFKKKEANETVPVGCGETILHILRDGVKMTSKDIYEEMLNTPNRPWGNDAKTPCNTVASGCGTLFKNGKIQKTDDKPCKYYRDNNI